MESSSWEIFTAVLTAVASVEIIGSLFRRAWAAGPGKRRAAEVKMAHLACKLQLANFEDLLGRPTMQTAISVQRDPPVARSRSSDSATPEVPEARSFAVSLFVDDLFFVEAVADDLNTIAAWSVTSRSLKFRPRVGPLADGIRIHSKLAEYLRRPERYEGFERVATAPEYFWEEHWGGNPGLYLYYYLSYNDAAPIGAFDMFRTIENAASAAGIDKWIPVDPSGEDLGEWFGEALDAGRRSSTFNTVGFSVTPLIVPRGPDINDVRVWRVPPTESALIRRRLRARKQRFLARFGRSNHR